MVRQITGQLLAGGDVDCRGIVYTLYQLPDTFRRYFILAYEQTVLNDFVLLLLLSAYLMTRLLLIGFSVNLVLRAVWVAFIGIHAAFPKDINRGNPKLSKWIEQRFPPGSSNQERLDKIEKACNLSYSMAILLCLISLSNIILMAVVFGIISKVPYQTFMDTPWFKYSMVGVVILIILGIFERGLFILFRKQAKIKRGLGVFFKGLDYFTLSFLYKREWLILISNIRAWKIQAIVLVYFTVGLLVSINQIGSYLNLSGFFHYELFDQRDYLDLPVTYQYAYNSYYNKIPDKEYFTLKGCLETDIVERRFTWLFIPYWKDMDRTLSYYLEKNEVALNWKEIQTTEERIAADSLYKVSLREIMNVYIDDVKLDSLVWHEHQLPKTAEKGWVTYLDTQDLSPGEHRMRVTFNAINWKKEVYTRNWLWIPFIKN